MMFFFFFEIWGFCVGCVAFFWFVGCVFSVSIFIVEFIWESEILEIVYQRELSFFKKVALYILLVF